MQTIIKYLFFLSLFLFFINCDDGLEDVETEFLSAVIFTPDRSLFSDDDTIRVPTNYAIPLADVSRGGVDRSWTLSEGGAFLREFSIADTTDLSSFIDAAAGLVSSEPVIHAAFTTPGPHTIDFLATFPDSTSFRFSRNFPRDAPLESTVFDDSLQTWVATKRLLFEVFAPLAPAFRVLNGTEELVSVSVEENPVLADSLSFRSIEIQEGTSLSFEDISPEFDVRGLTEENRLWLLNTNIEGSLNSIRRIRGTTAQITYNNIGTYFAGSFTQERAIEGEQNIDGTTVNQIPLIITVIPSTEPYRITRGTLPSRTSIALNLGGNIGGIPDDASNSFEIQVSNANGFSGTIPINRVSINPDNNSVLLIDIPEGSIFDFDTIAVNYDMAGNITSTSGRVLQSLSAPINVRNPFLPNLLAPNFSGVEQVQGSNNVNQVAAVGFFAPMNNTFVTTPWLRTTDRANSGSASVRFETTNGLDLETNNGMINSESRPLLGFGFGDGINSGISGVSFPAGTYRIGMQIFIESGTGLSSLRNVLFSNRTVPINYDLSSLPRNEWVEISQEIEITNPVADSGNPSRLDFIFEPADNPGVTGPIRVFIDDIFFSNLELRPAP